MIDFRLTSRMPHQVFSVFAVSVLAGTLAMGCGTAAEQRQRHDQSMGAEAPIESVQLRVLWQEHIGDNDILDLNPSEFGGLGVGPSGRSIVAVSHDGVIAHFDATSGELLWSIRTEDKISSTPAVDHRLAYVAHSDGSLVAYDLATGEESWRLNTGMILHGSPQVAGTEVFVSGAYEALIAVDKRTGRELWRHTNERFSELDLRGGPNPLITEDGIFVGYSDGTLYRLQRGDGAVVWSADLAGETEELRDVDSRPLLVGDLLIASSFSGGLHAFDPSDGSEHWSLDIDAVDQTLPLNGRRLITTANGERVIWVDGDTGEKLSEFELIGDGLAGPYALTPELVVLTDGSRGLRIIDTRRPYIHTEFTPGGGIDARPIIHGSRMYVLTNHGYLYALQLLPLAGDAASPGR